MSEELGEKRYADSESLVRCQVAEGTDEVYRDTALYYYYYEP